MRPVGLSRNEIVRLLMSGIVVNSTAIVLSIITFAIATLPFMGYLTGFVLIVAIILGYVQTYVDHQVLNRADKRGRMLNAGDYTYLLYNGLFLVSILLFNLGDTISAFLRISIPSWTFFLLIQGAFVLRLCLNVVAIKFLEGSAFREFESSNNAPVMNPVTVKITSGKKLVRMLIGVLAAAVTFSLLLFTHPLLTGGLPGDVGAVACIISGVGYSFFVFLGLSNAMLSHKLITRKIRPRLYWFMMISNVALAAFYTTPFFAMPSALTEADTQFAAVFGPSWNTFPDEVLNQFQLAPATLGSIFFGYHGREEYQVATKVSFCNGSGYELYFDVYYPKGPNQGIGRNATIIFIHGGAWWMGSLGMSAKELKYLASQGYVCFDIEYRLVDPHLLNVKAEQGANLVADLLPLTGGPSYLSGNYVIGDMVADIGNFTHFLSNPGTNKYGADLSKTVIIGQSAGAHLAGIAAYGWNNTWYGTNFSTDISLKGLILHYPPNNASEFFYYDHPMFHSDSYSIIPGTPENNADVYNHYTPSYLVNDSAPATLIIQGTSDMMVPPKNAQAIRDQMDAHGRPCIEVMGPFGGHAFDFAPHYSAVAIYYTERFLYRILN